MSRPPMPGEVVFVDYANKEINATVVVIGAGAKAWLRVIHAKTSADRSVEPADPDTATYAYLAIAMPPIRAYRVRIHLYAFDDDPRLTEARDRAVLVAQGMIIADAYGASDQTVRETAAVLGRGQRNPPVGILGPPSIQANWTGELPASVPVYQGVETFAPLKEVVRAILTQIKNGP